MVEYNSRLGSDIADGMSTVEEDDVIVDGGNVSCQNDEVGDHIIVDREDRSHRHAQDTGNQVVFLGDPMPVDEKGYSNRRGNDTCGRGMCDTVVRNIFT
jgi:hypothetical protein